MEVYILMCFDGSNIFGGLLGVYHTQSDAEFSRDEFKRENQFYEYRIIRKVIGARAELEY